MCNSYRIKLKRGADTNIDDRIADAAVRLKSDLVRESDPGIVMRAEGRMEIMRWGFHRGFNPAINNARSTRVHSPERKVEKRRKRHSRQIWHEQPRGGFA